MLRVNPELLQNNVIILENVLPGSHVSVQSNSF